MSNIKESIDQKLHDLLKEDPNVILNNFIDERISITSLLNSQTLCPKQLLTSITLIYKACAPTNDTNLVANLLCKLASCKDYFITAVSVLTGKKLADVEAIENDFLETVVDLLQMLVQRVPTASINILEILLPQLSEVCKKCGNDEHILNKLKELENQKEACIAAFKNAEKSAKNIVPPCDFRLLPNIPSYEEMFLDKPFFRPAIIDGPYNDAEQYLDIHFRLLREDMFRDFRKCLADFYSHKTLDNGRLYHNAYIDKIEQTHIGKLMYFVLPIQSKIDWKTTKRLSPGSLLCLSCDEFRSFYFASIYSRQDDGRNGNICYLALAFESKNEPEHFFTFYDIIEAGGYYESYSHVFENLRNFNSSNFPFQSSLLDYNDYNDSPFFLNPEQETRLKEFQSEINDANQSQAFELALRNKIALVQGPPGTGKSYLGVQIARYLTQFARIKKPIVVMCYTNHALDQFLEKMLDFTEKIVRIGGRSKNRRLEPHNLSNLTTSKNYKRVSTYNNYPEDDSFTIFFNIFKSFKSYVDRRPDRCYAKLKRESGVVSEYMDQLINAIKNPFTQHTRDVRLGDICQSHNILKYGNLEGKIFHTVQRTAGTIKLHCWLMIEKSFSNIYDGMADFKHTLTEELFNAIQIAKIFKRIQIEENTVFSLGPFAKLLIRLCIKDKPDSFFNQYNTNLKEVENFVKGHLYLDEDAFPLFFRTAVQYVAKKHTIIDYKCTDLWTLDVNERWKLLSILLFEISTLNITKRLNEKVFSYTISYRGRGGEYETEEMSFDIKTYERDCGNLKDCQTERSADFLQGADIIGMTTTGAAKNVDLLKKIKPTTYIVEEAAEVFESHIVASLVSNIKHLILIGDHCQLRPSPTVYDLAVKYHLDVSLFERLFKNGIPSACLRVQHRMGPSIAKLMVPDFYQSLENHPSVLQYENVAGVSSNVFFLSHSKLENEDSELKSHSNSYEASLIVTLCEYLVNQGHETSCITILTTYVGQLYLIKQNMQGRNNVKGVLATTVDNYQGEENDIILVSFVRSNTANKVGFIKTHNRLCVALSRARKGLYCVGNFNMFASQSKIWQSLIAKLTDMGSFGEKLEVNCSKHPKMKYFVCTPADLQKHIKNGCHESCYEQLPCGHKCDLLCHRKDIEHDSKLCNPKCITKREAETDVSQPESLDSNAPEKMIDSLQIKDESRANNLNNAEKYANSPHISNQSNAHSSRNKTSEVKFSQTAESDANTENNKAQVTSINDSLQLTLKLEKEKDERKVTKILSCGHEIAFSFKSIFTPTPKCKEIIVSHMKCGANVSHVCGEEANHQNCSSALTLQCGHTAACNVNLGVHANLKCTENVTVTLRCGHICKVPCHKKDSLHLIKCEKPCGSLLTCSHKCLRICNRCSLLKDHATCAKLVKKSLPCGHVFEIECSVWLTVCHERCMYHCVHAQCLNPCSVPCFQCRKPCAWNCEHHQCNKLCSELCSRPPCNEPCPKENPTCSHPCSGFCGEPCPTLCQLCDGTAGNNSEKLILLEDCGHSIPHTELAFFFMDYNFQSCPKCPRCHIPITKNVRFGNVLKSYYKSRNEKNHQHCMNDFPMMKFFQPHVSRFTFEEQVEIIYNVMKIGDTSDHKTRLSKLKVARQLSVLFCMNECWKTFSEDKNDYQELSHSLRTREDEYSDIRAQIFRNGAVLFIEKAIAEKKYFSNIGKVNEIHEDILSYLELSPFDITTVEEIMKIIDSGSRFGCPTLNDFQAYLKELCFVIA